MKFRHRTIYILQRVLTQPTPFYPHISHPSAGFLENAGHKLQYKLLSYENCLSAFPVLYRMFSIHFKIAFVVVNFEYSELTEITG
jgi:hypothetical protein